MLETKFKTELDNYISTMIDYLNIIYSVFLEFKSIESKKEHLILNLN